MIEEHLQQDLSELCFGKTIFPEKVLSWIAKENLWNIWVPKNYGGLELSLSEGLSRLQELARIDGSLGWTLTLCSGANYFIGNLQPETAGEIFQSSKTTVLGGSGGVFGKAEKIDDHYKISGTWRYATGATYLTHFTLNAEIQENGQPLFNEDGSPKVLSFVIPREKVEIIKDWNSMGLKASSTDSFKVEGILVPETYSFKYNQFYQPQDIFKIPFSVFADLTLWVNYIGMAEHFLAEARKVKSGKNLEALAETLSKANLKVAAHAKVIEANIKSEISIHHQYIEEVHSSASNSVKSISRDIMEIFPYLGVKASRNDELLNQIFRDYFTATQHHIFTK
ncbi:Acyl-CoA dehydrogenase, N-terminal domain [Salegentibacter holothuriorum]|uniref:Acyl-CoA dehydrogenase, N-terminal domain n=1 Tax=Salegentibacter holothuriorum TaxID=241145 RepID=A0A1T5BS10_9FLAO|nr:acyl-CoA dehydrogenase [Salegentibacter holothuriorum]SKB49620.1 Acyl-CoA dehydrogenase, N-terminal domain [Salegentibacter holothuriorum]